MQPRVLLDGLAMPESPRWHDGRLWFSNWGTRQIVAVDLDGRSDVVGEGPDGLGWGTNWLPDGRLLITGPELIRLELDGSRVRQADLTAAAESRRGPYASASRLEISTTAGGSGAAASRSATAKPSRSGSWISSSTTSGRNRSDSTSAAPPSAASPRTANPSASSSALADCRHASWSSTISTVGRTP